MAGTRDVDLYRAIARDFGHDFGPKSAVLDFGCGNGQMVRQLRSLGFEAYGTDIVLNEQSQFLKLIPNGANYRIPFDDAIFDAIISCSVLEHVKNFSTALAEMRRVLKPGGFCLHFFPPKLRLIEGHIFVPLAGLLQNYPWLLFWSFLGVRNSFGKRRRWRENALHNYQFLRDNTFYLSKTQINESVSRFFDKVTFAEEYHIKHSYGRARILYPIVRLLPPVSCLFSSFYMRVVFCEKNTELIPPRQ